LEQAFLERAFRLIVSEDIRPVVAPVDHMINGPGKFQPELSRHVMDTSNRRGGNRSLFPIALSVT
jgi:hypothetical protein